MKTLSESLVNQPKYEFVIIKPGFIDKSTRILSELLAYGFVTYKSATLKLSADAARELYLMHKDESFYDDLCAYMSSGMSIGVILINTKNEDLAALKDNIRNRYGVDEMRNAIHSSDSEENMKRESKIYFGVKNI